MIPKNESDKIDVLKMQFNQVYQESRRYSDMNWKNPTVAATAMIGLVAILKQVQFSITDSNYPMILAFIVLIAVGSHIRLIFVRSCLTINRTIMNNCREALSLFEEKAYHQEKSILPKGWLNTTGNTWFHCFLHLTVFGAMLLAIILLNGMN